MPKSDAELVQSTLEGNPEAFREIVERYQRLVLNVVYHYLGYADEAEDLSQEVFLKVFRALDSFDTSRTLKSWIARITANTCLDHMRRARSRRVYRFADLGRDDEERMEYFFEQFMQAQPLTEDEQSQLFQLLDKSMNQLNDKDRMAFVLRELDGLSYSEIAGIMGASELAIRIRVSRSRQKLHQALNQTLSPGGKGNG